MKLLLANPDDVIYLGRCKVDTNYDGKPGVRYELSLKGSLAAGNVNCTEEAYQQAANIPEFSKVTLIGNYNSDYRSFKVSSITVEK